MEDESLREGLLAPCCLGAVITLVSLGHRCRALPKTPLQSRLGWAEYQHQDIPIPHECPIPTHSLWDDHLPQKLCFNLSNYSSKQGVQKRCLTTMK